ncbi:MAG: RNA methyltransferase [Candidatus Eremiobacteraeota bacterium]|nr:RNA methyltransferase [Candidatus Eremiobacteraeota bacterium]
MKNQQDLRDSISIVLVSPKRSANVGAVARAMKCMGFQDLVLVDSRCQIDKHAFALATGSSDILEGARFFQALEDAVMEYGLVLGTTRRKGKRRYNFIMPRQMSASLVPRYLPSKIAIVFGPEDYGLSREHLDLCQYLVEIPTDAGFGSLNLAQAVMIICYELQSAALPEAHIDEEKATGADMERICRAVDETMEKIRYPARKKFQHTGGRIKEILSRSSLTKWEADMLMGIARHLRYISDKLWKGNEGSEGESATPVEES